jgi:hypothetical protein
MTFINGLTKARALAIIAGTVVFAGLLVASWFAGASTTGHPSSPDGGSLRWSAPPALSATPSSVPTTASPGPVNPGSDQPAPGDPGEDPVEPTATQAAPADVIEAAASYAAAWLNVTGQPDAQWRANLEPKETAELKALMADADPSTVPYGKVGSAITGRLTGERFAEVGVPIVDGSRLLGTLSLDLLLEHGRWLVNSVDWTKT